MQSIKMLLRQVGSPSAGGDIISGEDLEEYVRFNYGAQGYELHSTHYLGEVKNDQGATQGYRVMLFLTKDEEE
jgi:hypothetical protein